MKHDWDMEVERKFRLTRVPEARILGMGVPILQGYVLAGQYEMRVRLFGNECCLTVKNEGTISRQEWNKKIPRWIFDALWPSTEGRRIEKTRYSIPFQGSTIELDEYHGNLQGLVILEWEFPNEAASQNFVLPAWANNAIDVTSDEVYKNKNLAEHGFQKQKQSQIKIYVASNLGFSKVGRDFYYNTLIPSIQQLGYEILDPWVLTPTDKVIAMPYGLKRRQAWRKLNRQIGENNKKAIDASNGLVAILDGTDVDSGTAAEVGYAFARGKSIVGYRGDFRLCSDNEGAIVNLQVEYFILSSGGTIVTEADRLREELKRVFG